jgi:hypothetical protein
MTQNEFNQLRQIAQKRVAGISSPGTAAIGLQLKNLLMTFLEEVLEQFVLESAPDPSKPEPDDDNCENCTGHKCSECTCNCCINDFYSPDLSHINV